MTYDLVKLSARVPLNDQDPTSLDVARVLGLLSADIGRASQNEDVGERVTLDRTPVPSASLSYLNGKLDDIGVDVWLDPRLLNSSARFFYRAGVIQLARRGLESLVK